MKTAGVVLDLQFNFDRELEDDEVLCPTCSGTSLQIKGIDLAVVTEGNYKVGKFGKHESIHGCDSCYFGVQKKCKHCEGLIGRKKYQCECKGAKNERRYKELERNWATWNKTEKILWSEAAKKYEYLYIDSHDKYLTPDDLMEYLEEMIQDDDSEFELDDIDDLRIYGTTECTIAFDATDIISNGCSNLHEEAYERIDEEKMDELQSFLNNWSESVKNETTTYNADYEVGVIFTKEDYLKSVDK